MVFGRLREWFRATFLGTDRRVLVLALARMADSLANSFLIVVLPLYIASGQIPIEGLVGTEVAGIAVSEELLIGIVLSLFGFLNSFGQPFTGRLSDRTGRRRPFILAGLALLAAATIFGVGLSNILLSVTVLTAATAVVISPILGSIISGLFVLSDQSYEIGDMIELTDTDRQIRGFVEDITFQYTKIFTLDNTFLVIPNGTIRDRDVINYSAEDPRTRLSLDVLVTYEGDLAQARELIERAAQDVDTVIRGGPNIRIGSARYPAAPACYINEYADSGVLLTLRYWVREPYELLTVRSAVQENIWERLDGADVEFAYPHTTVVFDDRDYPSTSGEGSRPDGRRR